MRVPPAVPVLTSLALLVAAAPLGSAATAGAAPAAGTSTSALTVLSLQLAGHDIRAGNVTMTTETLDGTPSSSVVVTPLNADGTPYGEQTVTPQSSPTSVPSFDSRTVVPAALSALASVRSPVLDVTSSTDKGAKARAASSSLGQVSVLGLPVGLDGTVDVTSAVDDLNALGTKTISVRNLALPSVADLLGALGLDLGKVPVSVLGDLLAGLSITDPAVTAAQQALDTAAAGIQAQIDAAQKAVDDATAALAAKTAELAGAESQLAQKEAELAAATAALQPLKDAVTAAQATLATRNAELAAATSALNAQLALLLLPAGTALSSVPLLSQPLLQPYYDAVAAAQAAVASASAVLTQATADLAAAQGPVDVIAAAVTALQGTVAALQATVDGLQQVLDSAVAALNSLLSGVRPQLDTLLAAILAVLDATPLLSIDSLTVQTRARVTSAVAGGQVAEVVGGELQGLRVLGTDVLANVLGDTSIELLSLTGSTLGLVTQKVDALTGILAGVLSAVPGLSIPAPQVELLSKSTTTDISDGYGVAGNAVQALRVTLPAITLPAGLALPGAAQLPAFTGVPGVGTVTASAVGDLVSKPVTIGIGTLSERAQFRPAVTAAAPGTGAAPGTTAPGGTPPGTDAPTVTPDTTGVPELPRTGASSALVLLSVLLMGGAVALRRRATAVPQE